MNGESQERNIGRDKTLTQKLQDLCDKLMTPDTWRFTVEFRPFLGWYAVSDEPRHFNDGGEFLGNNYKEAINGLKSLLGDK